MNILVTGGAGFIGSHTLIELIASGHSVVVVDNLSNANPESLRRVESITGQGVPFYKVDIRDREGLSRVFALHNFDLHPFCRTEGRRGIGREALGVLRE